MNGFSTLNRLLGKKSKSQNISKSSSSLSLSSNKLTRPLSQYDNNTSATPAISSQLDTTNSASLPKVPFEQSFRITVHLPKGQLFVTRLGAKTELEKLLMLVCEHKQLDPSKYELRHPGDNSQVFSVDQTIGQVGLSEIRLCHKSESYGNFNAGEILTLRNTVGRDSLSSSELSSRNSKHTLKTASQYSSTNSLNSSDSAGMSNSRSSIGYVHAPASLQSLTQQKPPVAPARKKRAAPRPPSQNSQILPNGNDVGESPQQQLQQKQERLQPPSTPDFKQANMGRKEFHVSSPNLSQASEMSLLRTAEFHKSNISVDCNGNSRNSRDNNSISNGSSTGHLHLNGLNGDEPTSSSLSPPLSANGRPASMSFLNNEIHYDEKELNGNREFKVNGSVADLSPGTATMPEPAPRKRLVMAKKKAPAPPPRGLTPVATPRSSTSSNTPPVIAEVSQMEENAFADNVRKDNIFNSNSEIKVNGNTVVNHKNEPSSPISQPATPTVRITPTLPAQGTENGISKAAGVENELPRNYPKGEVIIKSVESKTKQEKNTQIKLTNGHADKPSTTPINSADRSPPLTPATPTTPGTHSQLENKLSSGTSSDDDDQVKVYNIKLGKTIVQPMAPYENSNENTHKKMVETSEQQHSLNSLSVRTESTSSPISTMSPASPRRAESPEWSYTIPAPPTFADNETVAATYRSEGSDRVSPSNRSLLSDQDDSLTTGDFQSETTITSDMEDGYRGGGVKKQTELIMSSRQPEDPTNHEGNLKPKKITTEAKITKEQTEITVNDFSRQKSISPPRSPVETKAEVINQLHSVINGENGTNLGSIVKRNADQTNDKITIKAAKPSELENFTIQSYNKTNQKEEHPEKQELPKQTVSELVPNKVEHGEDGVYIKSSKRPSLTLSNSVVGQITRQRAANIVRSDSFHSTRVETRIETGNLSQSRSTSHVSLEALQKEASLADRFMDTNRRKSSSELSIGETPSLQSLIVMKSILSSRKNSLTNGLAANIESELRSPLESIPPTPTTPVPTLETKNTSVIETVSTVYRRPSFKDFVSIPGEETITFERKVYMETKSFENSNSKNIDCTNTSLIEARSVNQSTSEVPVAGQANGTVTTPSNTSDCDSSKENSPKNKIISQTNTEAKPQPATSETSEKIYRYQGPPSINLSTWSERPKSQVAIKSDNDYIFGVGKGKARLSLSNEIKTEPPSKEIPKPPVKPFVRSVEYKKPTSVVEPVKPQTIERKPSIENTPVVTQTYLSRPMSVNNPLTFGGRNKPNFTPVVKGFKSLEPVQHTELSPSEPFRDEQPASLQRPTTVIRSNSAVSTNILRLSTGNTNMQTVPINISNKESPPPPSQPSTAPFFSQVALRKTGLKEKILANTDTVDSVPNLKAARSIIDQQSNSAKIEMKLTTTLTPNANRYSTPATFTTSFNRSITTINSEIPPPPPPIIRSVVTKQNSACIPDTRDQLLSAIRSFNKDSLKRS